MKCADISDPVRLPVETENLIRLPLGLLGFESTKEYVLLADPAQDPFLWLQVVNNTNLAFLVVPPSSVMADYQPDLGAEDVEFLGLKSPEDAVLFNIVTLREADQSTVNLKGPVVINRRTLVAKQVIPLNAAQYSVQHPLVSA